MTYPKLFLSMPLSVSVQIIKVKSGAVGLVQFDWLLENEGPIMR